MSTGVQRLGLTPASSLAPVGEFIYLPLHESGGRVESNVISSPTAGITSPAGTYSSSGELISDGASYWIDKSAEISALMSLNSAPFQVIVGVRFTPVVAPSNQYLYAASLNTSLGGGGHGIIYSSAGAGKVKCQFAESSTPVDVCNAPSLTVGTEYRLMCVWDVMRKTVTPYRNGSDAGGGLLTGTLAACSTSQGLCVMARGTATTPANIMLATQKISDFWVWRTSRDVAAEIGELAQAWNAQPRELPRRIMSRLA